MADESSPTRGPGALPLGAAALVWLVGFVGGMVLLAGAVLVAVGGNGDDGAEIWQLGLAVLAGWTAFVAAAWYASRRYGSGDLLVDHAIVFRPVDAAAAVVGALGQLLLIPALYVPLRAAWPSTFSEAKLEERARDLADRASSPATVVLLVAIVAVGAPIVEELIYRGVLQRSLVRTTGAAAGLVVASAVFTLVHPSPVEWPGLFTVGLLFGGCALATRRLGTPIIAHAAFNIAGLWLAFR